MADLIWSRKVRNGPENDMVIEFLEQYSNVFNYQDLTASIYTEPSLGTGFPDILLVFWDQQGLSTWNGARRLLSKTDIKIMHFIGQNDSVNELQISMKLGFDKNTIRKSLQSLEKSCVISIVDGFSHIADLSRVFFVKDIIAIEAKMGNWKSALMQAQMNQLFSSESYVLLPKANITQGLSTALIDSKLGLLEYNDNAVTLRKSASRNTIPASFSSWIINESVGREFCGV